MTQLAAFDSPIATFLDREIRELKNYPMVCQSLQAVAAFLRFDWNEREPYRDSSGRGCSTSGRSSSRRRTPETRGRGAGTPAAPASTARSRWNTPMPPGASCRDRRSGGTDDLRAVPGRTPELLRRFQARRLEAMERVANDFPGNQQTEKTPFDLPDLAAFEQKARTLAQALDEFVTIERHVELAAWKRSGRRRRSGGCCWARRCVVRYLEEDQAPGVGGAEPGERAAATAARRRSAPRPRGPPGRRAGQALQGTEGGDGLVAGGDAVPAAPGVDGLACDLDEVLGLTHAEGGRLAGALSPLDGRRAPAGGGADAFTPTAEADALRHAGRAGADHGAARRRAGGRGLGRGRDAGSRSRRLRTDGLRLRHHRPSPGAGEALHPRPGPERLLRIAAAQVAEGLGAPAAQNTLYERLAGADRPLPLWPEAAARARRASWPGWTRSTRPGRSTGSSRASGSTSASHGGDAGPARPGPARHRQELLDRPLRSSPGCRARWRPAGTSASSSPARPTRRPTCCSRTWSAVQEMLRGFAASQPEIFAAYFDPRLLDVPLFRDPAARRRSRRRDPAAKRRRREPGSRRAVEMLIEARGGASWRRRRAASTRLIKEQWPRSCSGTTSATAWCWTRRRR